MCILETLKMEDFAFSSRLLTLKYEEALEKEQDTEECLEQLCELIWKYTPLIEHEILVLNNVKIELSMNQFRLELINLYINGWDNARFYYNQIFDMDIDFREVRLIYGFQAVDRDYSMSANAA